MNDKRVKKAVKQSKDEVKKGRKIVHELQSGYAICGFSDKTPLYWPENHYWTHGEGINVITCEACKALLKKEKKVTIAITLADLDKLKAIDKDPEKALHRLIELAE